MDADGSNITRVTDSRSEDRHPAWSPDGTLITFQSDRAGDWDIHILNLESLGLGLSFSAPSPDSAETQTQIRAFNVTQTPRTEVFSNARYVESTPPRYQRV